jgi:multimeric flavodoxin WrbA
MVKGFLIPICEQEVLMKRITILLGSPRKNGNSAVLAEAFSEGAVEGGAEVRLFNLHEMDISPCTACDSCQVDPGSGCVIADDMTEVYRQLEGSDAIVFAGPVYWFSVSAQLKTAIDRMYAIGGGDANILGGKAFGVILTYADADPLGSGASNALRMYQDMASYVGARIEGVVHGCAHEPGEIGSNREIMVAARKLGGRLARTGD